MILYHGSEILFDIPEVHKGKKYRDFGRGFYLAESYYDALGMTKKRIGKGYLYTYEIEDAILNNLNLLKLEGYSEEWLKIIFKNRMSEVNESYDIIIGNTAGGNVNNLFKQYRLNKNSYESVVNEFKPEVMKTSLGIQWAIKNQEIINSLKLIEIEEFSEEDFD